jgi:hypothetical protein
MTINRVFTFAGVGDQWTGMTRAGEDVDGGTGAAVAGHGCRKARGAGGGTQAMARGWAGAMAVAASERAKQWGRGTSQF